MATPQIQTATPPGPAFSKSQEALGGNFQPGADGELGTSHLEVSKTGPSQALVPVAELARGDRTGPVFAGPVGRLPVELDVSVPVRNFRVWNLLALEPGTIVESQWGHGSDLPLAAGDVQLAWSEFEVVESVLAVRITRLA